jgi:hypothetical protein
VEYTNISSAFFAILYPTDAHLFQTQSKTHDGHQTAHSYKSFFLVFYTLKSMLVTQTQRTQPGGDLMGNSVTISPLSAYIDYILNYSVVLLFPHATIFQDHFASGPV